MVVNKSAASSGLLVGMFATIEYVEDGLRVIGLTGEKSAVVISCTRFAILCPSEN